MILKDGYTYIFSALAAAVFLGLVFHPYAAVPFVVLAMYFAYFFRNPERSIPQDNWFLRRTGKSWRSFRWTTTILSRNPAIKS